MDKLKKDEYRLAFFAYLMATLLMYIALNTPIMIIPVFMLAVSIVLIYAVVQGGYYLGGLVCIISFATICFFSYKTAGVFAAVVIPGVFAAGYVIKAKKRLRDSVLSISGATVGGVVLAIALLQLISGMSLVDFIVERMGSSLSLMSDAEIKMLYQTIRSADILTGAVTQQAVNATSATAAIVYMLDEITQVLNLMLVVLILVYSLIAGFLCYIVPRASAKKKGSQVAAIPAFKDYTLPKRLYLAYFAFYLLAVIGVSYGWPSFDVLEVTIDAVFGLLFVAQALSLLDFLYSRRDMGTGAKVVLHILGALVLGGILVWVGLIENAVGIRKRMDVKGGNV